MIKQDLQEKIMYLANFNYNIQIRVAKVNFVRLRHGLCHCIYNFHPVNTSICPCSIEYCKLSEDQVNSETISGYQTEIFQLCLKQTKSNNTMIQSFCFVVYVFWGGVTADILLSTSLCLVLITEQQQTMKQQNTQQLTHRLVLFIKIRQSSMEQTNSEL